MHAITWELEFGEFPTPSLQDKDQSNRRDQVLTDVDLRSTRLEEDTDAAHEQPGRETTTTDHQPANPDRNDSTNPTGASYTDHETGRLDDQQLPEGTDTIVPDVSDSDSDEMVADNGSPRLGKYNPRPNPTPNFTDEYRY